MHRCHQLFGATVLTAALAACGSGGDPPLTVTPSAPRATMTATATSSAPPTVAAATPASTKLRCQSTGTAPFDSASVTVTFDGPDVLTRWQWSGSPPASGTFGLFVTLDGPAEGDIHQLGFKTTDGKQVGLFDFDMASAQQRNLDDAISLSDNGAQMHFDGSGSGFEKSVKIKGAVTVDGQDVMSCK